MSYHFLMFSGRNMRAVLAMCRYMARNRISFSVVSNSKSDTLKLTPYKKYISCVLEDSSLNVDEVGNVIDTIRKKHVNSKLVLIPTGEYLVRFFHRNRNFDCLIATCDQSIYSELSNKESFVKLCEQYGIPVPSELSFNSVFAGPLVCKPKAEFNLHGRRTVPYIIKSQMDLDEFLRFETPDDYFYQEYLAGPSFYMLGYTPRLGSISVRYQQNGLQQCKGKSMLCCWLCNTLDSQLEQSVIALLESVKQTGFFMIEFILHEGKYKAIELNPRVWGPINLLVDVDSGIIDAFARDFGFEVQAVQPSRLNAYFWLGGIVESLLKYGGIHVVPEGLLQVLKRLHLSIFRDVYFRKDSLRIFGRELFNYR